MKAKGIIALGTMLAASLFVACSDDIGNDTGKNAGLPIDGYVKVAINMPTISGNTRAAERYDDGEQEEYAVNDALIVFFGGSDEESATFLKVYDLELTMNNDNGDNEQISTTSQACITEAPAVPEGANLYALAVVNPNGILKADDTGNLLLNDSPVFDGDRTIKALRKKVDGQVSSFTANSGDASFFMTNAPLSDKSGSDSEKSTAKASTLVKVNVYETEEEARQGESDNIYVERIVAKVSVRINSQIVENGEIKIDENSPYSGDKVTLKKWVLNVTNNNTKLVRDVEGLTEWTGYTPEGDSRFLAGSAVKANASLYRIFWAKDNNYDTKGDFTIYDNNNPDTSSWTEWNSEDEKKNVLYCLENTFDTDHQNKNETTSALIQGVYNPAGFGAGESFFTVGNDSRCLDESSFLAEVKEKLSLAEEVTVSIKSSAVGGYYNTATDKSLSELLELGSGSSIPENAISKLGTVKYYKDGVTYYTTLIRHFDEEETPWENGEEYTAEKHLGRYGVVRNTWYDLEITGISGLGEPEVPNIPEEPDDTQTGYINVAVNILSWALRSQEVDL